MNDPFTGSYKKHFQMKNLKPQKIGVNLFFFFLFWFTPCKAELPLRGMELQEKEVKNDYSM